MATSILSLVTSAARRTSLPVPTTLVTTPKEFEKQYLEVFYETGEDLRNRGSWPELKRTYTFTTTSATEYALPSDFRTFAVDTAWDQTNRWPLKGPLSDSQFSSDKIWYASITSGTSYRIFGSPIVGDKKPFQMWPAATGLDFSYDYISNSFIYDTTGATAKSTMTVDTDICVFPDELIKLGWRYHWLKNKGQDFAQLEYEYERSISALFGKLVGPVVSYRNGAPLLAPWPNTAEGGWNV